MEFAPSWARRFGCPPDSNRVIRLCNTRTLEPVAQISAESPVHFLHQPGSCTRFVSQGWRSVSVLAGILSGAHASADETPGSDRD